MKTISTDLQTHIEGEVTTLATCWKITRKDATVMGFTDHDSDLDIDGVTYAATTGFTPSAIVSNAGLSVDNLDVEGMLSSASLTEADIMAGLYDFAEIEVFMVNYGDLAQGILKLRKGWLGEVTLKQGRFVAEVRGLVQTLAQNVGELYSPSCRASLGDARCKLNMAAYTHAGTVDGLSGALEIIESSLAQPSAAFTGGKIIFTSGDNDGLEMEVKEHIYAPSIGARIILALPMPYAIAIGDAFTLMEGCDKTLGTCSQKYNNVMNFRGEPHVPGLDKMLETAGTRSNW